MGVASPVPRAGREIDVMSKFFEFRHDLRPVNTINVHSSNRYGLAAGESAAACCRRNNAPAEHPIAEGSWKAGIVIKEDNRQFRSTRYSVRLAKSRPPFVRSIASLSGAVFASTAVKMVRHGKRSPARPLRRGMTTDPVENHFENCRSGVGGSSQALATAQWGAGDAKAGLAED
ncbi:hypothetical protein THAOC_29851 [Thalassiosira oceanica]|uniref:Uncharacterized protein n=1 Tax=Thalassiosira oceanica TaxID=159749 RepID=K0RCU5_THAOC|nr:hypothetical protein THAOC_29851 [Thalassiosira oceanica]|eukprot:EJK51020.1 hypothetical protein THAOC_29851 [Thalassiosira oceanica]